MSGGFFALLDDIVAMAKHSAASIDDVCAAAGRARAKAAGVVIDDTAVTPRYVHGFSPERELPVIRKIAAGSLRNKLLFILPAAQLLSQFLPWLLTPILIIVALVMTLVVYGVVAVIVKMDDVGLHLATERTGALAALGRGLVAAMPKVLGTLSAVGIVAMLWVGGHILLVGLNDLGWHPLYELVHHAEEAVAHAIPGFLGATLAWLLNTAASAVLGLVAGAIVVAVMHLVQRLRGGGHQPGHPAGEEPAHPGETAGTPRADQPPDAVGHEPGREG